MSEHKPLTNQEFLRDMLDERAIIERLQAALGQWYNRNERVIDSVFRDACKDNQEPADPMRVVDHVELRAEVNYYLIKAFQRMNAEVPKDDFMFLVDSVINSGDKMLAANEERLKRFEDFKGKIQEGKFESLAAMTDEYEEIRRMGKPGNKYKYV